MDSTIPLDKFLQLPGTIFDVRSPSEHSQGHIPGSLSLPLFTDEERAVVGTTFKQKGQEKAILEGLEIVGPKLTSYVYQAKKQAQGTLKIHCWRGGMRSSSMAWLLQTSGLKCTTLRGGYKVFRRWALDTLQKSRHIILIGGLTGSGKTAILQALKARGEQVLDLENLAQHRGSSYGMLGMPKQPSNEQFENEIAMQWNEFNPTLPIWIEDENQMIGTCKIPDPILAQMRKAPLFIVNRPYSERVSQLKRDYSHIPKEDLIQATERIRKRLGGARTKEVVHEIDQGNLEKAIDILLHYYDSAYQYGLSRRTQPIHQLEGPDLSTDEWAQRLTFSLFK